MRYRETLNLNKIYFTKVFKGYNPEEVEAFIIKLNNDLQQKQMEFTDATKRLNSELNEIKKHFEETISKHEKLTDENHDLIIEKQNLQNEIKKLSAEINERPVEKIIIEKIEQKPEVIYSDENKIHYKQLCEQMGEKLFFADMRADEIIKKAQHEANLILAKAESDAGLEILRLVAEANKRSESIFKVISEYEKKQVFISAGLDQARKHITDAIGEVEALISADRKSVD